MTDHIEHDICLGIFCLKNWLKQKCMDVEEMAIQVVLSVFLTAGRNNGEGGSASLVK